MSVELRRGVAVYRTGGIVLEGSRNEFACRLRRVDVADPRLSVAFQLGQGSPPALPMRLSHSLIAAHKGSERNRLRRGECGVPSGAMLHARHFLAEFSLVSFGDLMANKLRFRVRVLAFGQTRKMLIANRTF
jgi:hypothetical protein